MVKAKRNSLLILLLVILNHTVKSVDKSKDSTSLSEGKCMVPADIVFLIDGSDSISNQDWLQGLEFVKKLIDALDVYPDAHHIGEIVFSSTVEDVINLSPFKNKAELKRLTDEQIHHKAGSDTAIGIERMREMFKAFGRKDATHIAIILAEGPSKKPDNTVQQTALAKQEGIIMMTVGIDPDGFADELRHIASRDDLYFPVDNYQALFDIVSLLKETICKALALVDAEGSGGVSKRVVGAAVGSTLGGLAIIGGLVVFLFRRYRKRNRRNSEESYLCDSNDQVNKYTQTEEPKEGDQQSQAAENQDFVGNNNFEIGDIAPLDEYEYQRDQYQPSN